MIRIRSRAGGVLVSTLALTVFGVNGVPGEYHQPLTHLDINSPIVPQTSTPIVVDTSVAPTPVIDQSQYVLPTTSSTPTSSSPNLRIIGLSLISLLIIPILFILYLLWRRKQRPFTGIHKGQRYDCRVSTVSAAPSPRTSRSPTLTNAATPTVGLMFPPYTYHKVAHGGNKGSLSSTTSTTAVSMDTIPSGRHGASMSITSTISYPPPTQTQNSEFTLSPLTLSPAASIAPPRQKKLLHKSSHPSSLASKVSSKKSASLNAITTQPSRGNSSLLYALTRFKITRQRTQKQKFNSVNRASTITPELPGSLEDGTYNCFPAYTNLPRRSRSDVTIAALGPPVPPPRDYELAELPAAPKPPLHPTLEEHPPGTSESDESAGNVRPGLARRITIDTVRARRLEGAEAMRSPKRGRGNTVGESPRSPGADTLEEGKVWDFWSPDQVGMVGRVAARGAMGPSTSRQMEGMVGVMQGGSGSGGGGGGGGDSRSGGWVLPQDVVPPLTATGGNGGEYEQYPIRPPPQ